jgi:hypothetical protein
MARRLAGRITPSTDAFQQGRTPEIGRENLSKRTICDQKFLMAQFLGGKSMRFACLCDRTLSRQGTSIAVI